MLGITSFHVRTHVPFAQFIELQVSMLDVLYYRLLYKDIVLYPRAWRASVCRVSSPKNDSGENLLLTDEELFPPLLLIIPLNMSFLDVVKRSIGVEDEEADPRSTQRKNDDMQYFRAHATQRNADLPRLSREAPKPESKRRPSSKTRSRFSQLSCEITQFQGIVRKLEALSHVSADSPETQWQSRILLKSAHEADTDIATKILSSQVMVKSSNDPNIRASYQKLKRDFQRAHDSFQLLSQQYRKRQQEAIAQLSQRHGWESPDDIQKKALVQQEVRV